MRRSTPIDAATAASVAMRRRAARLTQNDLALALGVSEGTISKIETARVPITTSMRVAIELAIERLAGADTSDVL